MKRQSSFGEYTVTIADSGSVEVYKAFKNALEGLKEVAASINLTYPQSWTAQKLGTLILKELNGGDSEATSAITGEYIISRDPNNNIKASRLYDNTIDALRKLSELVGYEYDKKWNTRTFGNKVIDAIESGEFKKLAKAKKIENTVEIEMDDDTTAEAAASQTTTQEPPTDAVLLQPEDPTCIEHSEFRCEDFISVEIPNSVTSINNSAFRDCTSLKSIVIPNSVTEITEYTFDGCTSLESIVIPNSVTKIDYSAFTGCEKVKFIWGDAFLQQDGVVYSGDRTKIMKVINPVNLVLLESLTEIAWNTFKGCTSLESIVIPNNVTEVGYSAFEDCTSLSSVVIPNSVTEIQSSTFNGCTSLKSIVIPNSVTKVGYSAFDGCTSLESIVISNSVTEISPAAFEGCEKVKFVWGDAFLQQDGVVYSGDRTKIMKVINPVNLVLLESLTEIAVYTFKGCTSLKSIVIPNSITKIGNQAFQGCTYLKSIVIPNSITKIGEQAFQGCTSLESIVIPNSVTEINYNAFQGCTSLESIVIPNSVTEIRDLAFQGCTSLESIVIPNSVTEISPDAFEGCDNLKSITIFKAIKKTVKRMDLPQGCEVIVVDQNNSATSGLVEEKEFTHEDYEEMGCPSDLEIPEGYTSIADSAFNECEDLESIIIPEGVTHIGESAFYNCNNLESVTLPDSLNTVGNFAFGGDDVCTMERDYEYDELVEDCGVLYNVEETNILFVCGRPLCHDINDDTTSIGKKFNSCETLDSIDFCDSQVEELEDHAFDGCYTMESVYLNNNLKKIGDSVFYGTKISELIIPASVTEIDKQAFVGCDNLKEITLPEMFKDRLSDFIVDLWDGNKSLADEKYEVSFH